jgi:cell division protein FtsN
MHGLLRPRVYAAPLLLAALVALSGCYARRPIASDPPPPRVQDAPAQEQAAPEPAPAQPEQPAPAAVQEKTATDAAAVQKDAAAQPLLRQYYVQVGAFGTEGNAQAVLTRLKEAGFEARVARLEQGQSVLFRAQAGPFQDPAAAGKALETLRPDWPQAFIPGD